MAVLPIAEEKQKTQKKKNNLCVWAWRLRACGFGWQAPKVLFHFQIHAVVSQSDRLMDRFIRIFLTLDLQLDLLLFFFSCADGVSRNGLCTSCNADGDNGPKSNKINKRKMEIEKALKASGPSAPIKPLEGFGR